jgi:DNA phosphorothioation-dependent restriction protein DptH
MGLEEFETYVQHLMQQVPAAIIGYIRDTFSYLSQEKWRWSNPVAQVRFLLTAINNEIAGDTLGAALYELGLVPDFSLFNEPATTNFRIRKNLESMQKLTLNLDKSIRGRVLDLELTDKLVQTKLI